MTDKPYTRKVNNQKCDNSQWGDNNQKRDKLALLGMATTKGVREVD